MLTRTVVEDEDGLHILLRYSEDQERDEQGRFGSGGGGGSSSSSFDTRVAEAAHGPDIRSLTEINPADPDVRQALKNYGAGGGYVANGQLRELNGDKESIQGYGREVTDGMDRAFESNALDRDIVVMRGIADPDVTFGGQEVGVGMEWTDHGYVSTSASSAAAGMFTGADYDATGGVEMRILAPAGTPAISTSLLGYNNEVVLDRGLSFRVVADRGDDFDGIRQLDVEVLPR